MIETKAENELREAEVLAKRDVAVLWCGRATEYTATFAGKPWRYLLIPDGAVRENIELSWLDRQYAQVTAPTGHHGDGGAEVDTRRPAPAQTCPDAGNLWNPGSRSSAAQDHPGVRVR